MTSSEILKLITDEQHLLGKRKQTALARGNWTKAFALEEQDIILTNLKKRISEIEQESRDHLDPALQRILGGEHAK